MQLPEHRTEGQQSYDVELGFVITGLLGIAIAVWAVVVMEHKLPGITMDSRTDELAVVSLLAAIHWGVLGLVNCAAGWLADLLIG